ncbi:MAG: WYL domain-containing protein [Acetobacter sp.]|nr:WYL domain-containing protein [Acetobacter sp.]MBR2123622.1 WYL domain-containing protein [Acetobacter sp.]
MSKELLENLTQSQQDRLAFIEFRLRFVGEMHRKDLVTRFGIQFAAASRDLSLYRKLARHNIDYDTKRKSYILSQTFRPLFNFSSDRVLSWLVKGFGSRNPALLQLPLVQHELLSRLTLPDLDVLACVTRAICQEYPLSIDYHSISNGRTKREIVPFALIDTGFRWHVRAFDRKSEEFRDFVITRIKNPVVLNKSPVAHHEMSSQDAQWTRIVDLELVPHPDQPRPEITEMDYNMSNGKLHIKVRAAVVGYVLRKWNVDCSPDHNLRGHEYRLWLKDPLSIYGVHNALLAPGYQKPTQQS